ncbi:MAG: hypothetical protein GPJ54_05570 [Candidatus Heimdallarchaeota archaeon]|nr:hypothetical protein [Candidatus Heimdallarchaeota archaeon]
MDTDNKLKSDNIQLNSEVDRLKNELNDLNSLLKSNQNEFNSLKEENFELKKQLKDSENKLEEHISENIKLIKAKEDTIDVFKAGEFDLKARLNEVTNHNNSLNERIEAISNEKDQLWDAKNDWKLKADNLSNELQELKTETSDMEEIKEELKVLRVLASIDSPALDLYSVLLDHRSMHVRKLAMQSGMAQAACQTFVNELAKNGIVRIDYFEANDPNPKVTLIG